MKPADVARKLPRDVKQLLQGSQKKMHEAALLGAEIIAGQAPVDMGPLKASPHVEVTEHGARIRIDAPHAGIVELGSRPHRPPIGPLIEWVRRHRASFGIDAPRGRAPKTPTRTLYGAALAAHTRALARHQRADREVLRIACALQAKIAREGTKPRYFVRNSMPRLLSALRSLLAKPAKL